MGQGRWTREYINVRVLPLIYMIDVTLVIIDLNYNLYIVYRYKEECDPTYLQNRDLTGKLRFLTNSSTSISLRSLSFWLRFLIGAPPQLRQARELRDVNTCQITIEYLYEMTIVKQFYSICHHVNISLVARLSPPVPYIIFGTCLTIPTI